MYYDIFYYTGGGNNSWIRREKAASPNVRVTVATEPISASLDSANGMSGQPHRGCMESVLETFLPCYVAWRISSSLKKESSLPSCSVAGQNVKFRPLTCSGSKRTGGKWLPRQMVLFNSYIC